MKFSIGLLALVPLVSAHFTLDYPATRGFDEDLEPQFCGGFPNPASVRQPFPLSGAGAIQIDSHHPTAQVAILAAVGYTNVTSFADFNKTASGQANGQLMPFGTIQGQGEWCFKVNFASLGVSNITNGTLATIQVEFNGGDGLLLQCADVVLVDNYVAPSNLTCSNATSTATTTTSNTTTTSGAPATSTTASGSTGSGSSSGGSSSGAVKIVAGGVVGLVSVLAFGLLV